LAANRWFCPNRSPAWSVTSPQPGGGHAAIGDAGGSAWLFPGGQPGRPSSAYRLAERLRELGVRSGQSRSTALFQLAMDLPAAVVAKMLGIHMGTACSHGISRVIVRA
jgi:hypothetical protein